MSVIIAFLIFGMRFAFTLNSFNNRSNINIKAMKNQNTNFKYTRMKRFTIIAILFSTMFAFGVQEVIAQEADNAKMEKFDNPKFVKWADEHPKQAKRFYGFAEKHPEAARWFYNEAKENPKAAKQLFKEARKNPEAAKKAYKAAQNNPGRAKQAVRAAEKNPKKAKKAKQKLKKRNASED